MLVVLERGREEEELVSASVGLVQGTILGTFALRHGRGLGWRREELWEEERAVL